MRTNVCDTELSYEVFEDMRDVPDGDAAFHDMRRASPASIFGQ